MRVEDGLRRVVITHVTPEVDHGRYAVKRTVRDTVAVEADVFLDGHDELACEVQSSCHGSSDWQAVRLSPLGNDHWRGEFQVSTVGRYRYRLEAWPDTFETWRRDLRKRVDAGQDVALELAVGAALIRAAAERAGDADRKRLLDRAGALEKEWDVTLRVSIGLEDTLSELVGKYPDKSHSTTYDAGQEIVVDPERARFSAWYEMFPRSASPDVTRAGTFEDVIARLPYVSSMGFDVLYLPPIHPIGTTHRKGKNNGTASHARRPRESLGHRHRLKGGHKAINPDLGTLADFQRLVEAARDHGIEIALDLAFQCSPDHPYVREHPEWFAHRPGRDHPLRREPAQEVPGHLSARLRDRRTGRRCGRSYERRRLLDRAGRAHVPRRQPPHQAVRVLGVADRRREVHHPDVVFLAEAFTRPNVMYHLAKAGFTQSYTYFTWRNNKVELAEYFEELTQTEVREFFRPNLWPNTPDILHEYLQTGGRTAFMARFVLAATLGTSYGIYGPAFELSLNVAREGGSEEYLDSEKYEIKHWDIDRPDSLQHLIGRMNRVRRDNPALQSNAGLRFHHTDNDQIIAYSKSAGDDAILVTVNLDPHHRQAAWVELPLAELGLDAHEPFQVHDLIGDGRYTWNGPSNFVQLDPHVQPAHVFKVLRRARSEHDFDYFG